jgi:hypothetical protein
MRRPAVVPSRTRFIVRLLAAAGTGRVIALVATAGRATAAPRSHEEAVEALAGAVLVAHLDDPRSGVVSLMVGEDEVEIRDPALVLRLVEVAGGRADVLAPRSAKIFKDPVAGRVRGRDAAHLPTGPRRNFDT